MQIQAPVPRTPASVDPAGTTPSAKIPQGQLPTAAIGQEQLNLIAVNPSRAQNINQHGSSSASVPLMTSCAVTLPSVQQQQQHPITSELTGSSASHAASMQEPVSNLDSSAIDQPMSRTEQIPNEHMLSNTNPASPPVHIRSILLNQQSTKGPVIAGTVPLQLSPSPVLGHSIISGPGDVNPTLGSVGTPSNIMACDQPANPGSIMNVNSLQSSQNPVTPSSESLPTAHNPHTFTTWPYQQPVIISENYHTQSLPLLPALQVSTPTSQSTFFKAFGT